MYKLLAIVCYIGKHIKDGNSALGHYIACIKRLQWEIHDDLRKKIINVSPNKIIVPHLIIYILT